MNDAQKAEYYEQEVNALFDTIAISVLPERRTCCDVFPEGYKDITPQEGPEGPDYLKVPCLAAPSAAASPCFITTV